MKKKSLMYESLTRFIICVAILLALATPLFYLLTKNFYAEDMIDIIEAVQQGKPVPAIDLEEDILHGIVIQFMLIVTILGVAIVLTMRLISKRLWLPFDKTSGPGDEGIVSQRVTIKALHNTGVERTAELHITGAGFDRKVTVVQEDGQVRIDGVELEGDMAKDEQVEKTYIAVNYSRAVGGEKLTVTPTLSGEGSDGLSVAAGEVTLDAGSGVARMAVTGTPTTFGEVLFKVAVELGDKSFGPYEVKSETANRMAAPTGLYVFRADSHEIIMEWDNDHSTVRTRKWAWQLLDSDADDAGVVREFTYEVNSNDDKNPKYVYNRFIIGALDPGTTYYFRVKRCPSEGVADDAGKIDSKWTELCPVTTKAEPEVPADAVLFQDFRYLAYGGNNVYTAFAGGVNDNPTGKALDQIFVPYEKYCNANSAAANLWTTHSAAYRSAVGLDGWVGGNNAAGHTGNNSVYGATGMLKLGTGSAVGWIQTPALEKLTGATDITVSFDACCWWEDPSSSAKSDNPEIKVIVVGPGTIDGQKEAKVQISEKREMKPCTVNVAGATAETHIEFSAVFAKENGLTNRWFLDNVLIVPAK